MFIITIFSTFLLFSFVLCTCKNEGLEWKSNCYYFNSSQGGFGKAEIECTKIGGHLASIHDAFTNTIIGQNAQDYFSQNNVTNFWIGGNSINSGGNIWEWTDGSNFDFIDWSQGEPSNVSGSNCIALSMIDGYWSAENCFVPKPFVCVVEQVVAPTLPPENCTNGWIYFEATNSCYAIFSPNNFPDHDWQWAENFCRTFDAHSPSIHSQDEQSFLHGYVHEYDDSAWLGLYSIDNGTTWQYTDNSTVDYLNWGIGEPAINDGKNCVLLTSDRTFETGWFEVAPCESIVMTACKKSRN